MKEPRLGLPLPGVATTRPIPGTPTSAARSTFGTA